MYLLVVAILMFSILRIQGSIEDVSHQAPTCNISKSDDGKDRMQEIQKMYQIAKKDFKVCSDQTGELFYCSDPHTCKKNHGLAVLTYRQKCAKCLGSVKGWILYLFLATFPTTIFFLIVFGCGIKATSAPMNTFLCIIQIGLYDVNFNLEYYEEKISKGCDPSYYKPLLNVGKAAFDIVSIWNLDFFRQTIPLFCINEQLKTTHVLAMEYIVAIYPLVCIAALYICIELHDRDFKPLVLLWKPFSWCLSKSCFKNYDPKMSIIEVFATFLILAYSKLLFTSFNLLAFTILYTESTNDSEVNFTASQKMLYDLSVPYLGREHLPFFVLAISILFVFNFLPLLLLLLYPTKLFQKALGCCTKIRWHPLHAFADAFHGCYKNGTNGTRDCRYFAALYLLFRALFRIPGFFIFTDSTTFAVMFVLLCHTFSMLIGLFRPYQDDFYNKLDLVAFFFIPLAQLWFCIYKNKIASITEALITTGGLIYYAYITVYKIFSVLAPSVLERLKRCFTQKLYTLCQRKDNKNTHEEINQHTDDDDEVFDRLENPQNYQRLEVTVSIEQDDAYRNNPHSYGTIN